MAEHGESSEQFRIFLQRINDMLQDGQKGVIIQRDRQTYAVAPHIPCGVVKPETLRKLADVAEKYRAAALKLTSNVLKPV